MNDSSQWTYSSPKQQSEYLWTQFLECFVTGLNATQPCQFAWAWQSEANRTSFYRNILLPRVASCLGLTDVYELFRVDSTFCVGTAENKCSLVPIVHVESENNARSASHEVRKLCALTGRLKVLIICDEWSDLWPHGGHAAAQLSRWRSLVANHLQYYPDDCVYGLVIGERHNDTLRFFATTLSTPVPQGPVHGEQIYQISTGNEPPCPPEVPAPPVPTSDI